jgi:hypothetical protein
MFHFRLLQVRNDRAQIIPLDDGAAEYCGSFEYSALWVSSGFLADARDAGFRFC